jgi:sugar phosphate isomerase/epimerase
MTSFTRGEVLRMLAAASFVTGAATTAVAHPARRWGIESGTILVPLEEDFHGTLRKVAGMGYKYISTSGSFGRDPALVRDAIRSAGLHSPAMHLTPNAAYQSHLGWARKTVSPAEDRKAFGEAFNLANARRSFEEGLASAQIIGQKYIVWSILLPEHMESRQALDAYIALFNDFSRICRREGHIFAIHNHAREFAKLGNDVILDLVLRHTDPLVKFEMDVYWVVKGSADVGAYLRAYPGRFRLAHLKDMGTAGEVVAVGDGTLDIPAMVAAGTRAGIDHFLVEIDKAADPLGALARSIAYLRKHVG